MASDVSGNDRFEDEEITFENEEVGKGTREEGFRENETEQITVNSIDYVPYLQDIQNDIRFNSVILLALVLLFGLLKGFKKL